MILQSTFFVSCIYEYGADLGISQINGQWPYRIAGKRTMITKFQTSKFTSDCLNLVFTTFTA